MRNISDKTVEEIKTHVSRSVTLFFLRKSCLYETMWKNTVEPDRSQIKIWRVRVACWIAKATHKHTQKKKIYIYIILIASPLQQWLHLHQNSLSV